MGADVDFIQGAVVIGCVIAAISHGAFNASVTFTIHCTYLHFLKYNVSMNKTASVILLIFVFKRIDASAIILPIKSVFCG